MTTITCKYNPIPTRAWSRVQAPCTYYNTTPTIPFNVANEYAMIYKGNILQYKMNSSNITKQQRYSQIAKGMWTNRNTTYATQSDRYSNPNTKSLKRVGYSSVNLTTGQNVNEPITCPPKPVIIIPSTLPSNPGTNKPKPPLPPPPKKKPTQSGIITNKPFPIIPSIIIPDGGDLICTITEDICTGKILGVTTNHPCNPTSSSDVPGPIIELCYNDGLPTYYPRQNLIQASSGGNKFPEGYKGFVSALHFTIN